MSEFKHRDSARIHPLEMLEYTPGGINEYVNVTTSAKYLQERLAGHLVYLLDDLDDCDEEAAMTAVYALDNYIAQDFADITDIEYGEELIAWGDGMVAAFDPNYGYKALSISEHVRLHGKLEKVGIGAMPVLDYVEYGMTGEGLLDNIAVAFYLENAYIADRLKGSDHTTPLRVRNFYLPLTNEDVRIKRRSRNEG